MIKIEYTAGNENLLEAARPLWEKLNEHHRCHSEHFADSFAQKTFDQRKEALLKKATNGELKVCLARDSESNRAVGYCISTIDAEGSGEIDSLYVESEYRGLDIGHYFMEYTLIWMDRHDVNTKKLGVAAGNEQALSFYSRYGFYPRAIVLEQVK